jgi:hypothetical protein
MMVGREITKDELLEEIETSHRQFERYIYYYERDEHGGSFSASQRPRFGREEMLQSGIWGEWLLKDSAC